MFGQALRSGIEEVGSKFEGTMGVALSSFRIANFRILTFPEIHN